MTDYADELRGRSAPSGLLESLRTHWQIFQRRGDERRRLAEVARLEPRLIRDIGLDPDEVERVRGGWELRPSGALSLTLGR